jgi:hypothetical protein
VKDYAELSSTPDQFTTFFEDVSLMQRTQPNYPERDLAAIGVPVVIAHAAHDEFIKRAACPSARSPSLRAAPETEAVQSRHPFFHRQLLEGSHL